MKLYCPVNTTITVLSANYGRTSTSSYPNSYVSDTNCLSVNALNIMQSKCNDQVECTVNASSATFGGDPCSGTSKYAEAVYRCVNVICIVENGTNTNISHLTPYQEFNDGESLSMSCLNEYYVKLSGDETRTCQGKNWTGEALHCVATTDLTPCDPPYGFGFESSCYLVSNKSAASVEDAADECVSLGGILAVPHTWSEINHYRNMLLPGASPHAQAFDSMWLGLYDATKTYDYTTWDGQYQSVFNWNASQPKSLTERCVVMDRATRLWSSIECSPANTPSNISFICEKRLGPQGCYSVPSGIQPKLTSASMMSTFQCIEYCYGLDLPYAALKISQCYCLNRKQLLEMAQRPSSQCNKRCSGHDENYCGGSNAVNVYLVPAYERAARSCDNLFARGVYTPSVYYLHLFGRTFPEKLQCDRQDPCNKWLVQGLSDSAITASSSLAGYPSSEARLHSNGAWIYDSAGDSSPWLQVTFSQTHIITAVATQGINNVTHPGRVLKYTLEYKSSDSSTWATYSPQGSSAPAHQFSGSGPTNDDVNTVVIKAVTVPFIADEVRLMVSKTHCTDSKCALRVDFKGCTFDDFKHEQRFMGCYAETNRAYGLDFPQLVSDEITKPQECITLCKQAGKMFAGITGGMRLKKA